jgi:hypothetical protein
MSSLDEPCHAVQRPQAAEQLFGVGEDVREVQETVCCGEVGWCSADIAM